jgi:hypothetical protein
MDCKVNWFSQWKSLFFHNFYNFIFIFIFHLHFSFSFFIFMIFNFLFDMKLLRELFIFLLIWLALSQFHILLTFLVLLILLKFFFMTFPALIIEASSYDDSQLQKHQVMVHGAVSPSNFKGKKGWMNLIFHSFSSKYQIFLNITVVLIDELWDNGKTLHTVRQYLVSVN